MERKFQVDLKGKTAIVSGAGGVIGKAIAKALAENGANVVITGRTRRTLEATCEEIQNAGGECTIITCDISNKEQIANLMKETVEK